MILFGFGLGLCGGSDMMVINGSKLLSGGRGSLGVHTIILPFLSAIFMLWFFLGGMSSTKTREVEKRNEHVGGFAG